MIDRHHADPSERVGLTEQDLMIAALVWPLSAPERLLEKAGRGHRPRPDG